MKNKRSCAKCWNCKKNDETNEPQNYLPKNDYKTYIWWEIATTTVPSIWYYNVLFDWHKADCHHILFWNCSKAMQMTKEEESTSCIRLRNAPDKEIMLVLWLSLGGFESLCVNLIWFGKNSSPTHPLAQKFVSDGLPDRCITSVSDLPHQYQMCHRIRFATTSLVKRRLRLIA